jgi:hypothetical protein
MEDDHPIISNLKELMGGAAADTVTEDQIMQDFMRCSAPERASFLVKQKAWLLDDPKPNGKTARLGRGNPG